jgi:hypothetical protein
LVTHWRIGETRSEGKDDWPLIASYPVDEDESLYAEIGARIPYALIQPPRATVDTLERNRTSVVWRTGQQRVAE